MDVYVGNLPLDITEEGLAQIFEPFGEVTYVIVLADHFSGRPLGFGFVEMPDDYQGRQAIEQLDRTKLYGRTLIVSETERRLERRVRRVTSHGTAAHQHHHGPGVFGRKAPCSESKTS